MFELITHKDDQNSASPVNVKPYVLLYTGHFITDRRVHYTCKRVL